MPVPFLHDGTPMNRGAIQKILPTEVCAVSATSNNHHFEHKILRTSTYAFVGCLTNPRPSDRAKAERMRRSHVCILEYPKDNTEARSRTLRTSDNLESVLSSIQVDASLKLRLFVVEDLSREVIEALGHHLKIDPSFFRDHIIDSQWDHLGMLGQRNHIVPLNAHKLQ